MTSLSAAQARPSWPLRLVAHARRILPEGKELPEDEWDARHRAILYIIGFHAVGVAAFGLYMGEAPYLALLEGGLVGLVGAVAAWKRPRRRFRGAVAALALVTSSAVIVQFSGGYIEAHFHFFVMLAVIALYQDWIPFLVAILYVALDHGLIGALFPQLVYNHAEAYANPWKWAFIHAALVLGESAALLMGWKIAEQARRRTALVLDSAAEGIVGLDTEGRITFANPAAAAMTQRAIGEMHGLRLDDVLLAPDERAPVATEWLRDEGHPAHHGARSVLRRDGTRLPVECERTPILNNGVVIGAVVTLKDVTERKRAEEDLRRAVSTLAATLESTTDGILVIERSGRIAGFNKRFVEMWGIPMDVLASGDDGRALAFVQDQLLDPAGFRAKVEDLYAHPTATSFDVLDFRDGRVFERYSLPQKLEDEVIGRVWSFRDVTKRRQAEQALREQDALQAANERLVEMDRMKTQFINNAAHELGTPLTPIKIQATLLNTEKLGPLSERQRRSVRVLSRNVDQLGLLLRDVIDSARVQAGRLHVELEPVRLDLLLHEAYESFQDAAADQGVELTLHAEPDVTVQADAPRLNQVFFNLLRNALKFTPEGGKVGIVLARRDGSAIVEVRDDGCGIRPEDVGRLFQPFSQVHDKMQLTQSGAGLGLYISHGIIESHGGTIACETAGLGQGTTFRVTLPLEREMTA